jgi:hypothetical protein
MMSTRDKHQSEASFNRNDLVFYTQEGTYTPLNSLNQGMRTPQASSLKVEREDTMTLLLCWAY